jgi:catechol-2,3-dioxygenase
VRRLKMADVPRLFRVILQVSDLDKAADFYSRLLGTKGRRIPGARHYLDCGTVILALLDPTRGGEKPKPNPDYVYFSARSLEKVHTRARELGCLSKEEVHGEAAGAIVRRPWGERSFYARDPFGNGLCFVDARTVFTGR